MIPIVLNLKGFRFEPGERVGERFEIVAWDESDPAWPVRAIDRCDGDRPVRLAVQAIGPWSSVKDAPGSYRDADWPDACPPGLMPVMTFPRIRHGGGELAVTVTRDYPAALAIHGPPSAPTKTPSNGQSPSSAGEQAALFDASPSQLRQLACLVRLHEVTQALADLHMAGHAHAAIDAAAFRRDPKGRACLRPVPGWHLAQPSCGVEEEKACDLSRLQRIVVQAVSSRASGTSDSERPVSAMHSGELESAVRDAFRSVIYQRYRRTKDNPGIGSWRTALDTLIRRMEAAWLSGPARERRRTLIGQLLSGDHDIVLTGTDTSADPWCIELAETLRRRRVQTSDDYRQWRASCHELPLQACAEQLIELIGRGYALPEPPPIESMDGRLAGSAHHLREAAAGIRGRDWLRAHQALSAASSLDPANLSLAGLSTLAAYLNTHGKD